MDGDTVTGDGQTLDGRNCCAGVQNRCEKCDSENHVAPERPLHDAPRRDSVPGSRETRKVRRPTYSTTFMEAPKSAQVPVQ